MISYVPGGTLDEHSEPEHGEAAETAVAGSGDQRAGGQQASSAVDGSLHGRGLSIDAAARTANRSIQAVFGYTGPRGRRTHNR